MKSSAAKTITALMAISILSLSFASCSKNEQPKRQAIIGSEGPWYEMKYFQTTDYGDSLGFYDSSIIESDGESITLVEHYQVGFQDEVTFDTPYEEKNDVYNISKYSLRDENYGELIGYYDIMSGDIMSYDIESFYNMSVYGFYQDGDYIDVLVNETDPVTYESSYKIYKVDLDTSSVVGESEVDFSAMGVGSIWEFACVKKTDDGYILVKNSWGELAVDIIFCDSDFNLIETVTIDDFGIDYIIGVSDVVVLDDNYFYFVLYDIDDNDKAVLFDRESGEMTEQPVMHSWNHNSFISAEKVYSSDAFTVKCYNMLNEQEETVVDFNNCISDRSKTRDGLNLVYTDDEKMVGYCFGEHGYNIIEMNKLDSDPFEGKEALSVAFLDRQLGDAECHAIYQYNLQSDDSYIYIDDRYIMDDLIWDALDSEDGDSYVTIERNAMVQIGNQLIVDIMAGEGPDIIFGTYKFSQFNNSNVLIDLNSLIDADESFDKSEYFPGIFESDSGILYQIPYQASVETLIGSEEAAAYCDGDYGMTLENYQEMISDLNNGIDPLQGSYKRAEYFIKMFNWNKEHFFENGEISIDRDYFLQIADFAANLSQLHEDNYWQLVMDTDPDVKFAEWLWADSLNNNRQVLGLPSPEGLPPILICNASIAITASCPNPEMAWDFAKILFTEESQLEMNYNMVHRDARIQNEQENLEAFIAREEFYIYQGYDFDTNISFRDDAVDLVIEALDSATRTYSSDSDIDTILYEEIQAYFAGDKTIDEVIELIENRVQLVLDERG